MFITVGTFNLNNLFSRFNFQGVIDALQETEGAAGSLTIRYEFTDPDSFKIRTFLGKLVNPKDPIETERIAHRINTYDLDVLAVQEVENIDILLEFNREYLTNPYPYQILIEGNDPRFIDVGLLSRLPVGVVTSHQTAVHPSDAARPVFGRDLLEVEIWNPGRTRKLFTLYNNHLKSNYVPADQDPVEGVRRANERRMRQAEVVASIVEARMRPDSRYIVLGDMNDTPESPWLSAMVTSPELGLVNALSDPAVTRPPKAETLGPGPQTKAWTYRHKETGIQPKFLLYDQIWISPALLDKQRNAMIDRRERHGGDGSDHDMAWITLEL
jgi:endonuclease/exonuclease/phosphatase family metal-dependent hydrolase